MKFWDNMNRVKWNQLYEFYDETVQVFCSGIKWGGALSWTSRLTSMSTHRVPTLVETAQMSLKGVTAGILCVDVLRRFKKKNVSKFENCLGKTKLKI